jgi:hypothetical protein
MSEQGIKVRAGNSDSKSRWAALDSRHERLVDISDRRQLDADRSDAGKARELKVAS